MEKRQSPTKRQLEVLRLIFTYRKAHGVSPTLAEIASAIGTASASSVRKHLLALEEMDFIERSGRSRDIVLAPKSFEVLK